MDFVIRIEGKLTIQAGESKGLLEKLAAWWPKRMPIQWREKSKRVLLSDVSARRVSVVTESREAVSFNVLCLTPTDQDKEPMFLATTLTTETREDMRRIVRLYSWRWDIEKQDGDGSKLDEAFHDCPSFSFRSLIGKTDDGSPSEAARHGLPKSSSGWRYPMNDSHQVFAKRKPWRRRRHAVPAMAPST